MIFTGGVLCFRGSVARLCFELEVLDDLFRDFGAFLVGSVLELTPVPDEEAKKNGCKVFYFWGHSYEMFEYEPLWQQLEDKIRYITEDPDAEWANVIDIVPLLGK